MLYTFFAKRYASSFGRHSEIICPPLCTVTARRLVPYATYVPPFVCAANRSGAIDPLTNEKSLCEFRRAHNSEPFRLYDVMIIRPPSRSEHCSDKLRGPVPPPYPRLVRRYWIHLPFSFVFRQRSERLHAACTAYPYVRSFFTAIREPPVGSAARNRNSYGLGALPARSLLPVWDTFCFLFRTAVVIVKRKKKQTSVSLSICTVRRKMTE